MSSSSEDEQFNEELLQHLSDDEEFPISDDEELKSEEKVTNWASAMVKVVHAQKSEGGVLSKAKKIDDIKQIKEKRKGYGFEIDGEVEEEEKVDLKLSTVRRTKERREIRSSLLKLRVKPSFQDREKEKTLQKIATKGLVQLFNAVRAQQKDLGSKLEAVGKPEYKREKVLKSVNKKTFLDSLMNGPRAHSVLVDNPIKFEPKKKKMKQENPVSDSEDSDSHKRMWGALKQNFMESEEWDKKDLD